MKTNKGTKSTGFNSPSFIDIEYNAPEMAFHDRCDAEDKSATLSSSDINRFKEHLIEDKEKAQEEAIENWIKKKVFKGNIFAKMNYTESIKLAKLMFKIGKKSERSENIEKYLNNGNR